MKPIDSTNNDDPEDLFGQQEADNNDNDEDISESTKNENQEQNWDKIPIQEVIIIGSGPAGCTAGLYLGRSGYHPLILHGHHSGGQLTMTSEVENFPTFKGTGQELVTMIQNQAKSAGSIFIEDEIVKANLKVNPKQLVGLNGHLYQAKSVILCTGAQARLLGVPNEPKFLNRGIFTCATCDGYLYKDKRVLVVGGGDSGITSALILSSICSNVTLVYRSEKPTASLPLRKRLFESNVTVINNSVVSEIIGEESVTGVQLKNVKNEKFRVLSVEAVFVAIGRVPDTKVFAEDVGVDSRGYFVKRPSMSGDSTATKIPGVFVAGDCADPVYRQAITSAGTGCMAALDAEKYLNRLNEEN